MRKLTRQSIYTKERSLDQRVSALERRFDPDPFLGLLPYGYSVVTAFTMVSGDAYSLGVLDGQFVGSIEGVSQLLTWGNVPTDTSDLGVFYSPTIERGLMCDRGSGDSGCMLMFDGALYLPNGFTGTASIWLDQQSSTWPSFYRSPVQNVYQERIIDPAGGETLRVAGPVIWGGSRTNPDTQSVSDLIHVVVSQDSGGDVDVGQGWMTITRVTPTTDDDFVTP